MTLTVTARTCGSCGREWHLMRRGMCGACYERNRMRQTAYGRWDSARTPADPVRAHVLSLQEAGVSLRQQAKLFGVDRSVIGTLLYGKPGRPPALWVHQSTAQKILAYPIPDVPVSVAAANDLVPAVGARRRLRALVAAGWTMSYLAGELGVTSSNFTPLIHSRGSVRVFRHRQVVDLFDRLQLTPGPSDRARSYALKRRWPLPMQWDEEALDNPAATAASRRRIGHAKKLVAS